MIAMIPERVILTGASGTLGYNLATLLAARGDVTILSLQRPRSRNRELPASIQRANVDFHDKAALRKVVDEFKPQCVIHCAATGTQFPKPNWFELVRFNLTVTLDLCECLSSTSNCNFVSVSTGLVYRDQGRPLTEDDPLDTLHAYGASKGAADFLVRAAAVEFGVPLTVVRPFSFTGPADDGSRLFPSLLRAAAEGRPFDLSPGDQVRDHCAVQDVAEGIWAAAVFGGRNPGVPDIFNLGSGDTRPLRSVIESVVEELDLKIKLNFGVRPYTPFEPRYMAANITRAERMLDWRPRTNLAHAVWQLAQTAFPTLPLREPKVQWTS